MKRSAGGWSAVAYSLRKAREGGGVLKMYRALRANNACKTCGLGMGGQAGGMTNELGRFPSVCKKSVQAMAADMQGAIAPAFFERYSLEDLKALTSRELEAMGRLNDPVYAGPGDTHYRVIDWEEAIERVVERLRRTPPYQSFFYFSGRSSNEAGFLLQLFAREYGTNNVNNCSYYCHQASGVGLARVLGSKTATLTLEDVEQADLLFIMGANPASNHPRLLHTVIQIKRRGGRVIVINPLKELGLVSFRSPSDARSMLCGTSVADVYIQPHIGGDIALLTGVGKALLERGAQDAGFVEAACEGWEELRASIEATDWDALERRSGVSRARMEEVAAIYAASDGAVFSWAMGVTHHEHGVDNVLAIANLALMRGMVGRPGAGLMPIRGHSNIQGMGSVGTVPELNPAMLSALEGRYALRVPEQPGLDTMGCMERAASGDVGLGWCLGGNLFGSNPDQAYASHALGNVGFMLYMNTTLNTGHAWGRGAETLILPVRARDEETQATTQESMFNRVRLSEGGPQRLPGPRSETEIISRVAARVASQASRLDWEALADHARIREMIAEVVPGYGGMAGIDRSKREFYVDDRIYHAPRFNTASGRARFHAVSIPEIPPLGPTQLRLMTLRSEGQFNTVVYEDDDRYRGQERRDVILLNGDDRRRLGLEIDQPVTVHTATGALRHVLVRETDIRSGNAAMYYPEANAIVPRGTDPSSHTPSFKHIVVTVTPEG